MSLHYLKRPPYAPVFPQDPPEQAACSRYRRCQGCPHPSHRFLCWGRDGRCLRTAMRKMNQREEPPGGNLCPTRQNQNAGQLEAAIT